MCLKINGNVNPKTARKDITCYKVVICVGDRLLTPFKGVDVKRKVRYVSTLDRVYHNEIEKGLHSCKYWIGAYRLKRMFNEYRKVKIIRCKIPKGSTYYEGKFDTLNGDIKSYASDTIIYS